MDAHLPETVSYQIIYKLHPNEDKVYLFLHKSPKSSGVQPWNQFFFHSTCFTACKFFSNSLDSSSLGNRSQVTSTKASNFCNAWTEKVKLLDLSFLSEKTTTSTTMNDYHFFGALPKHKYLSIFMTIQYRHSTWKKPGYEITPMTPFGISTLNSRYALIFESSYFTKLRSILITVSLRGHLSPFETNSPPCSVWIRLIDSGCLLQVVRIPLAPRILKATFQWSLGNLQNSNRFHISRCRNS